MRKLIFFIIILLVIVGLAPLATGIMTEKEIKNMFATINKDGQLMTFAIKSYDRSWLNAKAVYTITLKNPSNSSATDDTDLAEVNLDINHGPLIINRDSTSNVNIPKITFALATAKESLVKFYDKTPAVNIPPAYWNMSFTSGLTAYWGNKDGSFITYSDEQGSLSWNNFLMKMSFNKDFNKMKYTTQLGTITIKSPEGETLTVNADQFNGKMQKSTFNFWTGDSKLNIPSLTFNGKNNQSFSLSELKLSSGNKIDKELLNSKLKLQVKQMTIDGKNYGPGQFAFTISNIDATGLQNSQQSLQNNSSVSQLDKNKQQIATQLLEIISKNFQLNINPLQLTTPQGDVNLTFSVVLPSFEPSKVQDALPIIQQHSVVDLSVSLPNDIATNIAEKYIGNSLPINSQDILNAWVQQGLVGQDASNYTLDVNYDNGQLKINNVAMSFSDFQKKLLQSVMPQQSQQPAQQPQSQTGQPTQQSQQKMMQQGQQPTQQQMMQQQQMPSNSSLNGSADSSNGSAGTSSPVPDTSATGATATTTDAATTDTTATTTDAATTGATATTTDAATTGATATTTDAATTGATATEDAQPQNIQQQMQQLHERMQQ